MKRQYFIFLFLLTLIFPGTGLSQDKVARMDSLSIEIWPDYDQASVLVLLTGTLLASTKLPASVSLPLPETARLNAVARIDSSDGEMKDDIISTPSPDGITFIIPDLRFRVEYYLPYTVNNNQRTFEFAWLADVSVDNFQIRVQQPKSASSLTTVPGTIDVASGEDGFTYHAFPIKSVPAGQSFSVNVDYTMSSAQLSVASPAPSGVPEPALPSTSKGKVGFNWFIVAVVVSGIIILIVLVWQIATRRAASTQPAAHNGNAKTTSPSRFCPKCGNQTRKDDRFCGKCGSALQGE